MSNGRSYIGMVLASLVELLVMLISVQARPGVLSVVASEQIGGREFGTAPVVNEKTGAAAASARRSRCGIACC